MKHLSTFNHFKTKINESAYDDLEDDDFLDQYDDLQDADLLDQYEEELYDITSEMSDMNESIDSDMEQPSKLMDLIKQKFNGLGVDIERIYDLTKKYMKLGLATSVIMGALSSCASECANERISKSNNARYGRTVKHNNSNAFQRQNNAQFRGARVNRR